MNYNYAKLSAALKAIKAVKTLEVTYRGEIYVAARVVREDTGQVIEEGVFEHEDFLKFQSKYHGLVDQYRGVNP